MSTFKTLQQTLKHLTKDEKIMLLQKLSYTHFGKPLIRLQTLQEVSLKKWLRTSGYDFHYDNHSFLFEVAKYLGIDQKALHQEVKSFFEYEKEIQKFQQPYIFVDTNFKRNNQPIFALAMLESKRRIVLDKEEIYNKTLQESFKKVQQLIQEHYHQTKGTLLLWGNIKSYVYHHIDGTIYQFDVDGTFLGKKDSFNEPKAILSLK